MTRVKYTHRLASSSASTAFIIDLQNVALTGKVLLTATQHYYFTLSKQSVFSTAKVGEKVPTQ